MIDLEKVVKELVAMGLDPCVEPFLHDYHAENLHELEDVDVSNVLDVVSNILGDQRACHIKMWITNDDWVIFEVYEDQVILDDYSTCFVKYVLEHIG